MLKHTHSFRRRSLNVNLNAANCDSKSPSTSSALCPDASNNRFQRKYNRSVKVKSRLNIDGTTVVLRSGRQLSRRAKSGVLQPFDGSFSLAELKPLKKSKTSIMKKFVQVKQPRLFADWTNEDLCEWLKQSNLDRDETIAAQFRKFGTCGRQLAEPDAAWKYMNKMMFKNEHQKQEVLLKIAELLRENVELSQETNFSRSLSKSNKHSLKVRPASALNFSTESVTSLSDYVSGSSSPSTATATSSSSEQDRQSMTSMTSVSTRKVMKTLSNLKNAISKPKASSPTPTVKSQKNLQAIIIFSDLQSPGRFAPRELHVTETTTTTEVIQIFLDCSSNTDDINLFTLSNAPASPNPASKGNKDGGTTTRIIGSNECPLPIYRSLFDKKQAGRRLELTQERGVNVKITCHIGKHGLRAKQFCLSMHSSVKHVIKLALRRFRLRNVDPDLFILCDMLPSGDVAEIVEETIWRNGKTFLLSDRSSIKNALLPGVAEEKVDFNRSCSVASDLSFHSQGSSDSWVASSSLEASGRDVEDGCTRSPCHSDVTIEDIRLIDELPLVSPFTMTSQLNSPKESKSCEDTNSLKVNNAILRAAIREKEEQMCEVSRKVEQVRRVLEGGLQDYHNDSYHHQVELNCGASLTIENELKNAEQRISNTESLLGQLFRHQRQILTKQNSGNSPTDAEKLHNIKAADGVILTDVELQIALHQADLLALKHKHQVLDMKMSLFVANRKAEKFRHMINSSLYEAVVGKRHNNNTDDKCSYTLHTCELFAEGEEYGLVMRDVRRKKESGSREKGVMMDRDHTAGNLRAGDRLLEVNGINVQTVGTDFIKKILKDTNSARIVALRNSPFCENNVMPDDDVISEKLFPKGADWREMTALQSDLAMLMTELEVTSRAKRELERDLARKKNRDVVLEAENARLREEILELRKQVNYDST